MNPLTLFETNVCVCLLAPPQNYDGCCQKHHQFCIFVALGARTNSEQLAGRCCFSARRCPAKSVFCQCTKDISYIWSIALGRYSTETTTRRTSNHNEDMVPRMSSLPNAQSKSESVANGTDMIDHSQVMATAD